LGTKKSERCVYHINEINYYSTDDKRTRLKKNSTKRCNNNEKQEAKLSLG